MIAWPFGNRRKARRESVDERHAEIENHDFGIELHRDLDGLRAVCRERHFVAHAGQQVREAGKRIVVVVGYENALAHDGLTGNR
jgi:hypothetical protein